MVGIDQTRLHNNGLTRQILTTLDRSRVRTLVKRHISDVQNRQLRTLDSHLTVHTKNRVRHIFRSVCRHNRLVRSPQRLLLRHSFTRLPCSITQRLVRRTSQRRLHFVRRGSHLPLQLHARTHRTLHRIHVTHDCRNLCLSTITNTSARHLTLRDVTTLPN